MDPKTAKGRRASDISDKERETNGLYSRLLGHIEARDREGNLAVPGVLGGDPFSETALDASPEKVLGEQVIRTDATIANASGTRAVMGIACGARSIQTSGADRVTSLPHPPARVLP